MFTIEIVVQVCYNIYSERGKAFTGGGIRKEVRQMNLTSADLIAQLIKRLEELARENERLKLEIMQLKNSF